MHLANLSFTELANPPMAIIFTVELPAPAARNLYLDRLENTVGLLA